MATWNPISKTEILEKIKFFESNGAPVLISLWNKYKVPVVKWQEKEYGSKGNGFWVVATTNSFVVWYNDIEEGFNISEYKTTGEIDEYSCEQDDLAISLNKLSHLISN
ncbi:MAG: hypothetical protein ABJG68_06345 [Crocinitomicaceae bacterium]